MSAIRFPLLAAAFLSLLLAMWAGLLRAGWSIPLDDFAAAHGVLMVAGFLGTLISLERAVALNSFLKDSTARDLPYLVPLFSILGAAALVVDLPLAALLVTLSSLGLSLIFVFIIIKQPAIFTLTMGLGAVVWWIGNLVWLAGEPFYASVPFWIGFLVLTIAGERLELSRLMRTSQRLHQVFAGLVAVMLLGILMTLVDHDLGFRLIGIGEITLAVWLLRYDVVRRTIRQTGLTRYIAACLMIGYVWLAVSGVMMLYFGGEKVGFRYDAMLHSVFLGFVFSMIFGHALLILPSVAQIDLNYSPTFYGHLALLHISLLLRVGGDLGSWLPARRWGALLNAVVLLLFLANTVRSSSVFRRLPRTRQAYAVYLVPVPLFAAGAVLILMGLLGQVRNDETQPAAVESPFIESPSNELSDPAIIEAGERTFQTSCSSCHGMDGRGLPGLGKDLINSGFVQSLSDTELHAFIVQGRPAWDAANTTGIDMPPRGGNPALSDSDIDHIIAYLRAGN